MIAEIALATFGVVAVLLIIMLLRAAYMPNRQPKPGEKAMRLPEIDVDAAASRLAAALRLKTVNTGDKGHSAVAEFSRMRRHLAASYPCVFERAEIEEFEGGSIMLRVAGSDSSLDPVLFMGHMDVVPVEEATAAKWSKPAFDGIIEGGVIWGRGALDCKHVVFGLMEAANALLKSGRMPERSIMFAFGHDEETGGAEGAAAMGRRLAEQGIRPWMVVDEGGKVDEPGYFSKSRPEAVISIGEKGYASFRLEAEMPGGHAARPSKDNAVNALAKAVVNVNSYRFQARLDGPVHELLGFVGTETGFWTRLALANMWLLKPLVLRWLSADPSTDCIIRTTAVATMLKAGVKDNVIPSTAEAVVNTRPAFGETPESVKAELERAIGDTRIKVVPIGAQHAPSKVAPLEGPQFSALTAAISAHFPEAVIVPGVLTGGTDTKHYATLCDAIYRFVPIKLSGDQAAGVHGINERIHVEGFAGMVRFYMDLMIRTAFGGEDNAEV